MTSDDKEIVSAIRASLADRIGKDCYEVWFGPSTQFVVHGGTLTVSVPTGFVQDWLRSHYRKEIEASSIDACGEALALGFQVDEQLASKRAPRTERPPAPNGVDLRAARFHG